MNIHLYSDRVIGVSQVAGVQLIATGDGLKLNFHERDDAEPSPDAGIVSVYLTSEQVRTFWRDIAREYSVNWLLEGL